MECEYCGRRIQPGQMTECPGCGAPIKEMTTTQVHEEQSSSNKIEVNVNGFNISIDGVIKKKEQEKAQQTTPGYTGSNYIVYGGFWRRVCAWFIDAIILSILCATGIGALLVFLYEPFCETYWNGSTIGKKVMGLRVVNQHMENITLGQAYGRYFSKLLSYASCYIGFIMVAFSRTKRSLHDRIAGTYVIYVR